jgi:hypothetical protein
MTQAPPTMPRLAPASAPGEVLLGWRLHDSAQGPKTVLGPLPRHLFSLSIRLFSFNQFLLGHCHQALAV